MINHRRNFPTGLTSLRQLAGGRAGIERVIQVDSSQGMLDRGTVRVDMLLQFMAHNTHCQIRVLHLRKAVGMLDARPVSNSH